MGICFKTETVIDLKHQAPAHLGMSRNGRPVHYSFLIRGVTKGVNGHKLEAARIGKRWVTSVEAIQRWAERQTDGHGPEAARRTAATRRRADADAERELKRRGL